MNKLAERLRDEGRKMMELPGLEDIGADLLDAAKDVERLDKLEALKKSGERWMIHDWTFHENITAYIGVWLGSNYPHKSHETLRAAVDSIRGDNE